jgi:hypothetical protein
MARRSRRDYIRPSMRLSRPLLLAALLAAPALASAAGPGWISDDWPRALAEARARQVPIFVDAWAPW